MKDMVTVRRVDRNRGGKHTLRAHGEIPAHESWSCHEWDVRRDGFWRWMVEREVCKSQLFLMKLRVLDRNGGSGTQGR